MSSDGWYGFDLDGTLAEYDHWRGIEHIGVPIPLMVNRVKAMLKDGHECRIFTARVYAGDDFERDVTKVVEAINAWCLEHVGRVLPVTNVKDFGMISLFDDRAVQVKCNVGLTVEDERDAWIRATEHREDQIRQLQREIASLKDSFYNGGEY